MNRIKKALEKCRTYVAVQKFGCGMTGIGHGVEDNILQFLNEADEELARLEKREPTLMSDCISAGLPLDVALRYDVQLCRLTNYVRDKTLADCVKQEPVMGYEHICALREGEQHQAEDSYFFVRPENDTPTSRKMFCQGFERGFHKGLKYAAPVSAEDIRAEALREAAKLCLKTGIKHPQQTAQEACSAAILGLICQ